MAVIHTAYTIIKMPGPRGVITLKSDQRDALACENASLTHAGRFDEQEAQNLAAKITKTHGGGTSTRTIMPIPVAGDTLKIHVAKKDMTVTPHQPSAPPISWWLMRERGPQTRRFRWTLAMMIKSSVSVQSWRPNRNSHLSLCSEQI
jgi:hypothetical protein